MEEVVGTHHRIQDPGGVKGIASNTVIGDDARRIVQEHICRNDPAHPDDIDRKFLAGAGVEIRRQRGGSNGNGDGLRDADINVGIQSRNRPSPDFCPIKEIITGRLGRHHQNQIGARRQISGKPWGQGRNGRQFIVIFVHDNHGPGGGGRNFYADQLGI